MSTKQQTGANRMPAGADIDPDFHVPSCTVEDVDRAVFNLFEKDITLQYSLKKEMKKIPVIFATGERFAVLRRKKPLRDKVGATILPLISISRTGVNQNVDKGMATNQTVEMVVKKKLSPKDPVYQRLLNKEGLENQDNRATPGHYVKNVGGAEGGGAVAGTVAKRRPEGLLPLAIRQGKLIDGTKLGNNFFEIYTMPPPKYFTAEYEVTIWAQYTQQMNNILMAIMNSYHSNGTKSFRVESDKGYWFVAYLDAALSSGNNFDDFSDDERIVRYSFSMTVPGYIINPTYPGAQPTHRRYISAPQISFDMTQVMAIPSEKVIEGIPSGDPQDYILDDLRTLDDPEYSRLVAKKGVVADSKFYKTTSLGGAESGRSPMVVKRVAYDPLTGDEVKQELEIKMRNQRKGETVYREQVTYNLGQLKIEPQ